MSANKVGLPWPLCIKTATATTTRNSFSLYHLWVPISVILLYFTSIELITIYLIFLVMYLFIIYISLKEYRCLKPRILFCSLLYPQCLKFYLAHSCSINICWMSEKTKELYPEPTLCPHFLLQILVLAVFSFVYITLPTHLLCSHF